MLLEMVKTMNMNQETVKERYHFTNPDLLREIEKEKSILVACSHYANWEWNVSMNLYVNSKGYAVYQKIGNKYFDRLIKKIRSKWNTTPITQKQTVKTVIQNEQQGNRAIYGMVSDQSPQVHLAQYWTRFMGVMVPVYNGPEVLARKLDLAVVFAKVSKVKRGFYAMELIPITLAGKKTAEHEITEQFLRLAEMQIAEEPAHYLWTHKRWKHRNKVPNDKLGQPA